ncbi:MAG: hypothetical protein V3S00_04135 [Dehalococcoidia bacterium]
MGLEISYLLLAGLPSAHPLLLLQQIAVLVAEGASAILANAYGRLFAAPEKAAGVATFLGDGHGRRAQCPLASGEERLAYSSTG